MVDSIPAQGPTLVRAAGTVLWRATTDDPRANRNGAGPDRRIEVAVAHRPRYADWSLPKGKREAGETLPACAVRETAEETGYTGVLGRRLREISYRLSRPAGAHKVVAYWAARARAGRFEPNDEVDELRWLTPDRAAELLTYSDDREVLASFAALPADPVTVLLVRHAKAGRRSRWTGDDDLRPLTRAGQQQADALRLLLPLFGADRVFSAPLVRCRQTVAPLAADLGVPVTTEPRFSDAGVQDDPTGALRCLVALAAAGGTPVVCGQGGGIPWLLGRLADRAGLDQQEFACKKGSVWVLSLDRAEPGRLLHADYLPTALAPPMVSDPD